MSYELINLTLPVVVAKIEDVLEDYPEHPYRIAFSLPELRQRLLAHVLTRTPNYYAVPGEELTTLKGPKSLYPALTQEQVRMENLIHGGILHLLREHAGWVGDRITHLENSTC